MGYFHESHEGCKGVERERGRVSMQCDKFYRRLDISVVESKACSCQHTYLLHGLVRLFEVRVRRRASLRGGALERLTCFALSANVLQCFSNAACIILHHAAFHCKAQFRLSRLKV